MLPVLLVAEKEEKEVEVTLDIVSDGDIDYAMRLSIENGLQDRVFFHSTKTTSEIAKLIQERDALLMFSNYENFPCVIAESMMCGKPVISSNVNGIPEHVHGFNGILINAKDEEGLSNAIVEFISGERSFDSGNIRKYAEENFGYRSVGMKFLEIYKRAI